ncbi:hypothetical protein FJT64_014357 [Amphibalanus amphitrite]|uniref:Uncharacterized protein n=1 Tax=Amphibalanus amphitrite TaxID=1232801 RepID=A0A6A4VC24_AMPAM|nr:hypothetical protein FJT64_014357 [Amphibalanus amphitrite]
MLNWARMGQHQPQQLQEALQERERLQEQLRVSSDTEQRLNRALTERDELQLRVQDPGADGPAAADDSAGAASAGGSSWRRPAASLRQAQESAQHQINLQALEAETRTEQLELRIADLEPLREQLEAAEARLNAAGRGDRVSELELSVSASRAAVADPLVAPTSSPFLEETGSSPPRDDSGWHEFTPALEAVSPSSEAPARSAELERVTAELIAEQTASLQLEVARLTSELETERSRSAAADEVPQLSAQLTEQLETVTQLRAEVASLQMEVARLTSELETERSRPAAAAAPATAGDEVAQLSAQLAEELATVTQLSGELESERADVARLESELQQVSEALSAAQAQLSAARSAAAPTDSALTDQLTFYRQKVAELETMLAGLRDELQQAKVKNGRLLQKLKVQQMASRGAAAAPDALDAAMLEEARAQATEASQRAEEAERQMRNLQQEKARLSDQVGTYQDAQERLLESKERLEAEVHALRLENDHLRGQLTDLEWRLAELEEAAESRQQESSGPTEPADGDPSADVVATLRQEKAGLEQRLADLERIHEELVELHHAAAAAAASSPLPQPVGPLDGAESPSLAEQLALSAAEPPKSPAHRLTGADPAAPVAVTDLTAVEPAAAALPAAVGEELTADQSPILRSREAIIHGMAEELNNQRATIAALRAEAAQWRTLAEEGEDGAVVEGLNEHLRLLAETLHSRDARCSQLTTEVAQLLEERDLLQLRLSSALRSNQSRGAEVSQPPADDSADVQQLKLKLAELKQLNYLLDIQLQGEVAERRRLQRSMQTDSPQRGRHHQQMTGTLSPNTSDLVSSSSKDI